ncbi:ParA family protein [Simkania negevensis]|uniref:ParA family protein n=1 Tax=Simkania negevensis TaxID=83561 RepID=A0ABS3AVU3_9BACT|nr:ParA family protein [Simkania negevensis]
MDIIAASSFKGGTAKTSTALHLGAALVKYHKKKVLLVDFDAQANLTAGLGYDPDEHDSLAPVLQGEKNVEEVLLPTCINGLDIIPADTWLERVELTGQLATDRYSHERLKELIAPLAYDVTIIDTPPSLCWLTESALIAAHYSLVCATPEFYSIKGLERLATFMDNIDKRHPLQVVGVALSFWNTRGKSNDEFLQVVEATFPNKIFQSKVRRDISVSEASIYGKPLFETAPKSRAAEDYLALTNELLGRINNEKQSHEQSKLLSLQTP